MNNAVTHSDTGSFPSNVYNIVLIEFALIMANVKWANKVMKQMYRKSSIKRRPRISAAMSRLFLNKRRLTSIKRRILVVMRRFIETFIKHKLSIF